MAPEATSLTVDTGLISLAAEEVGEGPTIVAAHGLTASRSYVVHGSNALARRDHRLVTYDARGHGSSDPAPAGSGYGYEALEADLEAVIDEHAADGLPVLAGHSMGAHTLLRFALSAPDRVAGIVVIGPAWDGSEPDADALADWDAMSSGLRSEGIDGFVEAWRAQGIDDEWEDRLETIVRRRLGEHDHLDAVADALAEVPRSAPFGELSELEDLDVPVLVVASHDEADPSHPYELAERYADLLPQGRLVSEDEGDSPLAWQGGKLSREIASFCQTEAVRDRLG
ncbi:MAG: alpha/beta fold hydrolase [Solirubrobacterales bacterium]